MAYDTELAKRVRNVLAKEPGFQEKKMFGGVCYLLQGNMACGVLNEDVIVRVGKEAYDRMLRLKHTRKFDITGRAMTGWIMVSPEGHRKDNDLFAWVQRGIEFVATLPPKK